MQKWFNFRAVNIVHKIINVRNYLLSHHSHFRRYVVKEILCLVRRSFWSRDSTCCEVCLITPTPAIWYIVYKPRQWAPKLSLLYMEYHTSNYVGHMSVWTTARRLFMSGIYYIYPSIDRGHSYIKMLLFVSRSLKFNSFIDQVPWYMPIRLCIRLIYCLV